jgi:hypothetical protein
MEKLEKVLVVMEVLDPARLALARAVLLARHFGARLELFLCDVQAAYEFGHAYDSGSTAAARTENLLASQRYLESVLRTMADDVAVTVHAACQSPLCEAVARRVLDTGPDLVIKAAAGAKGGAGLDSDDWQLARTSPAPLLLTAGRPWRARPRFAVLTGSADDLASRATAAYLARGVDAQVDVLEVQDPATAPARGDYDLIVVGSDPVPRVGSLAYRPLNCGLLSTLDCDILVIDETPALLTARQAAPALGASA